MKNKNTNISKWIQDIASWGASLESISKDTGLSYYSINQALNNHSVNLSYGEWTNLLGLWSSIFLIKKNTRENNTMIMKDQVKSAERLDLPLNKNEALIKQPSLYKKAKLFNWAKQKAIESLGIKKENVRVADFNKINERMNHVLVNLILTNPYNNNKGAI